MCVFFSARGGEGMQAMRIMGKSLLHKKKNTRTHHRFQIKSGRFVIFFFSRGTAQNFKGD